MKLKKIKEIVVISIIVIFFLGICLAAVSLLVGCSAYKELIDEEPQVIEKEVIKEVIKEKIVYLVKNITIPCNTTDVICPIYNNTPRERELELIRRLRYLESQQNLYFNDSECNWELNRTKIELEDCKDELCDCEYNNSWC